MCGQRGSKRRPEGLLHLCKEGKSEKLGEQRAEEENMQRIKLLLQHLVWLQSAGIY